MNIDFEKLFALPQTTFEEAWVKLAEGKTQKELEQIARDAHEILSRKKARHENLMQEAERTCHTRARLEEFCENRMGISRGELRHMLKLCRVFTPERRDVTIPIEVYQSIVDLPRDVQDVLLDDYRQNGTLAGF